MVCDFFDGVTITDFMQSDHLQTGLTENTVKMYRGLSDRTAHFLARQIVEALEYLHETVRVLHGDLHHGNMIVNLETLQVKLIDFGESMMMEARENGRGREGISQSGNALAWEHEKRVFFYPDIFALGECAEHRGICYGLVEPAYEQARALASHLAGGLRHDHAVLCGELAVLKKAEGDDGPPSWQTLRDVCARLSIGLSEHIRHEERMTTQPSTDHYSDYRYLQVITGLMALENRPFLLNSRYHLLTGFLRGLHVHMDKQEAELFPVIEQAAEEIKYFPEKREGNDGHRSSHVNKGAKHE